MARPGPRPSGEVTLAAAKFRPPAVGSGIVPRKALVDRLLTSPPCPVVCVTAPPGYGKTTLPAQWAGDSYAIPVTAQVLLQLGHAYLELADPAGARAVLRDVTDILRQRPDLGVVPAQAEELRSMVSAFRESALGASSLTTTELRIIPFLATYLSLGEIAERLHVSRNTIKTHTNSIYQKLGATSRSEANRRVAEIGLLIP